MWVGGDAVFLVAMIAAVWVWMRAEEAEGRRLDAKLDREAEAAQRAQLGATSAHDPIAASPSPADSASESTERLKCSQRSG